MNMGKGELREYIPIMEAKKKFVKRNYPPRNPYKTRKY
jgi:hypothetical protein